jgi:predicted permease
MNSLIRDLHYAVRLLSRHRTYSGTVIATLAVCVGVNVAIFTVVNSVLLRPLDVPDGDRIVLMANDYRNTGNGGPGVFSYGPDYFDRLTGLTTVEDQALFTTAGLAVEVEGRPERIQALVITPSFFRLVRGTAMLGRTFDDSEQTEGNHLKVVLSYRAWQRLLGADPEAIGRDLRLNGRPYTVVGVMPPDFQSLTIVTRIEAPSIWIPLVLTEEQKTGRHGAAPGRWVNIGRLKPGATLAQAQAQLQSIDRAVFERFPDADWMRISGFRSTVSPYMELIVGDVDDTLYLLWGSAIFVLLIGVANVANLTLAHSTQRLKELATRLTLGAGRAALISQLATENLILAIAGAGLGLLAGAWLLDAIAAIGLERLPRASEIRLDGFVVGITVAVSVVLGILVAFVPIGLALTTRLREALWQQSRLVTGGQRATKARHGLIVSQVAMACILLMGSLLLLESLRRVVRSDPGFIAEDIVTAAVNLPANRYRSDADIQAFLDRALDSVKAIPGVVGAGFAESVPLDSSFRSLVWVPDDYAQGQSTLTPLMTSVTPGYLEALGMRLVRGRFLDEHDNRTAARAVVVDERLAQRFWPDGDAVGRRVYLPFDEDDLKLLNNPAHWATVVGVVARARVLDLAIDMNDGAIYCAYHQPFGGAVPTPRTTTLVVKTPGHTDEVVGALRSAVSTIDPELPVFNVTTMTDRLNRSLVTRRMTLVLAMGFAATALFLSALGVYGVLAYLVARRTKEFGIRIALGGTLSHLRRLILNEGMRLVSAGVLVGLVAAFALRGAIENQLYGVRALDLRVAASAILAIVGVSLIACVLPARRATRVDPAAVLNQDR